LPKREHRELRDLLRYRRKVIQQRGHEVQRVEKTLQTANIKLSSVASDILGVSGRAMLEALIRGEQDPAALAELARGRMKSKKAALAEALEGSIGAHQRFMLRQHLDLIDTYDRQVQRLDEEVEKRMDPFEVAVTFICEIHGLGRRTAEELIGEIGTDMSQWKSERHLSSWAKVSPGNNESGSRKRSGGTGKGGPVREILIQAALNVSKDPNTYYGALYRRLCKRGSKERALVAVAHALLVAIYHMLRDGTIHRDLGPNHFDERRRQQSARNALRHLQRLGYNFTLEELEARRVAA
jgi:transposase